MGLWSSLFGAGKSGDGTSAQDTQAKLATASSDYAPGGRVYKSIEASQGTAAADRAYAIVQGHVSADAVDTATIDQQIQDEFQAGLMDGYNNLTDTIKSTIKAPFQFAWDSLPWQVYAVGGVLFFIYLGGAKMLKGILKH